MDGALAADDRPRLGVVYSPDSVELPSLIRATRRSWPLVWLVDEQRLDEPGQADQLGRLGDVVEISGLAPREIAGVLPRRLDGLLATNDADLVLAAEIARELGLATLDPATVHRLTDKSAQREALRAAGLPVPGIVALRSDADAAAIVAATGQIRFPAVLKPARGSGSRATRFVDSAAEVSDLFEARRGRPVEEFVVEERIPDGWGPDESAWADYVSVESFVCAGRIEHFGITGRTPLTEGLRETGSIMPAELPSGLDQELIGLAEDAIRALGVQYGVTHTEVKLSPLGPRVIEVNGRLGGGSIRWLAERVTGTSLLAAAARVNLGLPPQVEGASFEGVGFSFYFQPPLEAREVRAIDGLAQASALPGVEEVIVLHPVGDRLDPSEQGSMAAVVIVRGWAATHDAVAEVIRRLRQELVISYG